MPENDQPIKAGRAGGRAARVAARAAGPPVEERAVRPGFSGGAYKPLSEDEKHLITLDLRAEQLIKYIF